MNTFFYVIIFIMGTLFGSFFTLAVYRIPKGENIIYKHSYCPNCNHKLGFCELIPVISYILLHGKCAHCGQKIRIRYLCLELMSGVVFVLLAISTNFNIYSLTISRNYIFCLLCTLFCYSFYYSRNR